MSKRLVTKAQRELLEKLLHYGQAIRQRPYYSAGWFNLGFEKVMDALAKKKLVEIETVGRSAFAKLTDAGRAALSN